MIFEHDIDTSGSTIKLDERNAYTADEKFKSLLESSQEI